MWKGFKFGLGFALAVTLVFATVQGLDFYGRCAAAIDKAGVLPPMESTCAWVGMLHKPKGVS
jgi:hypothetical protein